jgi:hypothetical protein
MSEYVGCDGARRANHWPGSNSLCKKDHMVRNLRQMRLVYGPIFNFVPTSFVVRRHRARTLGQEQEWECIEAAYSTEHGHGPVYQSSAPRT